LRSATTTSRKGPETGPGGKKTGQLMRQKPTQKKGPEVPNERRWFHELTPKKKDKKHEDGHKSSGNWGGIDP